MLAVVSTFKEKGGKLYFSILFFSKAYMLKIKFTLCSFHIKELNMKVVNLLSKIQDHNAMGSLPGSLCLRDPMMVLFSLPGIQFSK